MRYVYNFSVDCNTTDIGDIVDIHKYLKAVSSDMVECLNVK